MSALYYIVYALITYTMHVNLWVLQLPQTTNFPEQTFLHDEFIRYILMSCVCSAGVSNT